MSREGIMLQSMKEVARLHDQYRFPYYWQN